MSGFECNLAGAQSTARDLDAGNVEAASQKLFQCLKPSFSGSNQDAVRFASEVKKADRPGVGYDVSLHLRSSLSSGNILSVLPEIEIK